MILHHKIELTICGQCELHLVAKPNKNQRAILSLYFSKILTQNQSRHSMTILQIQSKTILNHFITMEYEVKLEVQ